MTDKGDTDLPRSPETQAPSVREQLEQDQVSHDGVARPSASSESGPDLHRGAVEDEVTPISPPMRGPDDLVSDSSDVIIDPDDEITPG